MNSDSRSDREGALKFKTFTGGIFDTNGYLLQTPAGNVLVDAPDGAAEAFAGESISHLLLTHGHYDHVVDAARIQREHRCPVYFHPDTTALVSTAGAFRKFGFALDIEPFRADHLITEGPAQRFGELEMDVFEVPGHCPGSLCFYHRPSGLLFGGDVLFAGAIGRWDLPGGNLQLLLSGIRQKLFPLPENTRVLSGHGPETTLGREKRANPFFQR
ncbi:MAG TPA: MBL fold metallo-hydrolase [Chthoniobacterales bacterium]